MPENKPFMMELKCKLTEEDKAVISRQIVEKLSEKEEIELAKSAATSHWGSKIKDVNKEIAGLAKKHREGQELREVECYTMFDWTAGIASVIRSDTYETVSTRTITSAERQRQIDDDQMESDSVEGQPEDSETGDGVPDGGQPEDQAEETSDQLADGQVDIDQADAAAPRDNNYLRDILSLVMDKAPSKKTVKFLSASEFNQALEWAQSVHNGEKKITKPAFLGK